MKRWGAALFILLLCVVTIFLNAPRDRAMFGDTDTRVLLEQLEKRDAPLSWFGGDWPLENHFYRPVSTLVFEFDRLVHPGSALGFGLTSAALCAFCVLALFWFVRELTDDAVVSASCALLLTVWTVRHTSSLLEWLPWLALPVIAFGLWRHSLKIRNWLPAVLVLFYLPLEVRGLHIGQGSSGFPTGVLDWLPGRTATTMTVFCLLACAAYARYERTGAAKKVRESTPLDPPATRSSIHVERKESSVGWALLSIVAAALALGSYEQAVMLPAVLLGVAVLFKLQGYGVRWGWQAAFWGLLVGYLALRRMILPQDASGYQMQQFRDGLGVALILSAYIAPTLSMLHVWPQYLSSGIFVFLTKGPYMLPLTLGGNVAAYVKGRRHLQLVLGGLVLSFFAFLPMAWLKPFVHYHYWPMAMRTLLVVGVFWAAFELVVTAVSPPRMPAPRRRSPAPGSLPRP